MRAFLLGVLMALLIVPGGAARAQDRDVSDDIFYEELAPYGDWFEHPRWGVVWQPRVDQEWRPYTQGNWSYTDDYGWYWVSDEPFGWAVFHYGRWVFDEDDGWIWLPGTEWAPAWVAWRWGDDYVGWTALAPGSDWGPDGGLRYDASYYESSYYAPAWCFVSPLYLTTPGLYRYIAPRRDNVVILRRTRHEPGYRRFDRRVVNTGFDVRRFEQLTGRPATRVRLQTVGSPHDLKGRDRSGPELRVFMPRIITRPDAAKRMPQLKERPLRTTGPASPGSNPLSKGPSGPGGPPAKDFVPGAGPRVINIPPSDGKGPPTDAQKQLKQVSPPPGTVHTDPNALRKSGPPPQGSSGAATGFKGQDVRAKDGKAPSGQPGGPPPLPKGPPPAKKDDKDKDKKGGDTK